MEPGAVDVQRALHALGEPTRFRVVQLLTARPHTVGEVAAALGALQPQTTKHLQVLEAARVVRVHRLGRRRVARLDRETLTLLAEYFGELAATDPDDAVLDGYERAIARGVPDLDDVDAIVLRFERVFAVTAEAVWEAWTDPACAAAWWAPRHFSVAAFELEPRSGAPIRLVLREGDGAEYESRGHVEDVGSGRLVFSLAPIDAAGEPLFEARHILTLTGEERATARLVIEVSHPRPEAAAAIAGLEPGWHQLLDSLDQFLRAR